MFVEPDPVILLVEDRFDDIVLARRAFEKAGISEPVFALRDGDEAIDYLSGRGQFEDRSKYPIPGLILLDLNLPKVDGFEVLKWVRNYPETRGVAVVVLTSSEEIADVNRAYALGANSFLVKPADFENLVSLGRLIRAYWMKTVKLTQTE
jgi:CheY-like chemotaxis protein